MNSPRVTAVAAESVLDLVDTVTDAIADGVVCDQERARIARDAQRAVALSDHADNSLFIVLTGLREQGVHSPKFQRKNREYLAERPALRLIVANDDDDPDGPGAMKKAA